MPSTKTKILSHFELNEPVYNPRFADHYRFNMLSFPALDKLTDDEIKQDARAMGFKMTATDTEEGQGVVTARFHVAPKDVDSWATDLASKGQTAIAKGKREARASYVNWTRHLLKAGHKDVAVTEDLMDVDDGSSPSEPEFPRQCSDHPTECVESHVRPEVPARELRVSNTSEKAWADYRREMASFTNPFEERGGLDDELAALVQSVRFAGSPAKLLPEDGQPGPEIDMGMSQSSSPLPLPYPFSEAAFLEEFVRPLFEREREQNRGSKTTAPQLTLVDRLLRSEDTAVEILSLVDATEKEWRKLVACSRKEWRDSLCYYGGAQEWSPVRALTVYKSAYTKLREKVEREISTQGKYVLWRCRRAVALLRAERAVESQVETKPIMVSMLPEPEPVFDAKMAARSLLVMLGCTVA